MPDPARTGTEEEGAATGPTVPPGALSALLVELARAPEGAEPAPHLEPGAQVGRFEIVRRIGAGGFGVLYEARDPLIRRAVALKLLRHRTGAEPDRRRALAEAEAAAQVSHPNVVSLFDVGLHGDHPYLVMELLEGESLADRLARGPLAPGRALEIALAVASAVAHAHARGVVHRDVKPSNVFLLASGAVKLLDFGVSRLLAGGGSGSGGTPGYAAPEQGTEAEDERVDVYAVGKLVQAMLARQGEDGGAAPPVRLPPGLAETVEAAVSPDPADRPVDGGALRDRLQRSADAARRRRSRRWATAIALPAALAAGAGGVLWSRLEARRPAPVVAVADLANETGDPSLSSLAGLLATALEQSEGVRVVARTRLVEVLRAAGRGDVGTVDAALGREAAVRTAAGALLEPRLRRFDDLFALEVVALDPRSGDRLFSVRGDGTGRASLPALFERIAGRALDRLGARASRPPPRAVLSASVEANQHLFRGRQLSDQHRYDEAMAEFRRAAEIDPALALARLEIARNGWLVDMGHDERAAAVRAVAAEAAALPPRERELLGAMEDELGGRPDAAIERYRRLADLHPEDRDPPYLLAEVLFHGGRMREALPWYERALALDPAWPLPLTHVAMMIPPEEAVARARRALELLPGPGNHWALAIALARAGDREGSLAAARRMAALAGTPLLRAYALPFLVFAERLEEAEAEARALEGQVPRDAWSAPQMAGLLSQQGRIAEGWEVLEAADAGPAQRAIFLAARGDRARVVDAAAPALARLEAGMAAPFAATQVAAALAEVGADEEASRAAAHGLEGTAAVTRAVAAWRRREAAPGPEPLREVRGVPAALGLYFLGAALAEAGRDAEAVDALARYERVNHAELPYRSWALPRALYLLARSQERLGRTEEALATVDRLLAMWRRADPDLPLLRPAKELRARVIGPRP